MRLYQRHLAPGGIIAFHISNTYLNCGSRGAGAGRPRRPLSACLITTEDDDDTGAFSSDWVLVTAINEKFLALPEIADASAKIQLKPGLRL